MPKREIPPIESGLIEDLIIDCDEIYHAISTLPLVNRIKNSNHLTFVLGFYRDIITDLKSAFKEIGEKNV